jgi:hypothetical protein
MATTICGKMAAGLGAVRAVVDLVREDGRAMTGSIHLFAFREMSRPAFDRLMALVVRTGLVRWEGRGELVWVVDHYAPAPDGFEESD